ncbi:MAG: alpha-amylase family glycosyl hydrolase [Chitinispirillaceae bacterium]
MHKADTPQLIYNLFPRLFRTIDDWSTHLDDIEKMNFNAVYVNPFHEVGGSNSLYAVKDYFKLNPQLLPPRARKNNFTPLKQFLAECRKRGMDVHMDLVINHTANESVLIKEHPEWYKRNDNGEIIHPYAIDPANPSDVTVWGDLSEIDYENNPDFEGLRQYWDKVIAFYQDMGISGFRCDAAYKVPRSMWEPLISNAKKRDKTVKFLAESLGCTLDQIRQLDGSGFDYLFNSSKWWNFEGSWCLDQHSQFRHIAPSISFPESHDTSRVAQEQPQTIHMQKNRYLLSALFSKGLLMPIGYEHGSAKPLHVVESRPEDLEDRRWDLKDWIAEVNKMKLGSKVLSSEGRWRYVTGYDWDLLFMIKESEDGSDRVGVLINKDWHNPRTVNRGEIPPEFNQYESILRPFESEGKKIKNEGSIQLSQNEIVLFK